LADAPELSVVIPAYNESHYIPDTLWAIKDYLSAGNLTHEIIVVDDGSRDDTAKAANSLRKSISGLKVISNETNRGKGYAVRRAVLEAIGNLILMCDADQSAPIQELDKLHPPIKEATADIVIGSRALPESRIEVHQPFYREPLGYIYNDLIQLLLFKGIEDTQCGFKLYRRQAALDIFSRATIDGFAFDVEALLIARIMGYRIAEIPIRWRNYPDTSVRMLRHGSRMLIDLFRIKWNSMRGIYKAVPGAEDRA
jgi:dolichyl-phosphate beta-glucosyltransferase